MGFSNLVLCLVPPPPPPRRDALCLIARCHVVTALAQAPQSSLTFVSPEGAGAMVNLTVLVAGVPATLDWGADPGAAITFAPPAITALDVLPGSADSDAVVGLDCSRTTAEGYPQGPGPLVNVTLIVTGETADGVPWFSASDSSRNVVDVAARRLAARLCPTPFAPSLLLNLPHLCMFARDGLWAPWQCVRHHWWRAV